MSMIQVSNVSKWYGEVSALNEVSLEIEAGILGLLGPNGAGKSTLLKLMAGQLEPSIGEITILGESFHRNFMPGQPKAGEMLADVGLRANNAQIFAKIGFCPEQDSLWEEFSGPQFLAAMLRLQGWLRHDADKRARELIGQFKLEDAGNKRVGGYSKGMRQKLRIAQSIAHHPSVLFLDEPMSGLDATSRGFVADLIREMAEHKVAVVVSSHILHEVESLTKDMVLINQGRLRARGNVYEIRELLTDHPLQLELHVDRPRALAQAFLAHDHIIRVEMDAREPEKIVFFTRHQNQFFLDLPEVLEQADIHIKSIHAEDEDMESVFKYLVN